MKQKSFYGDKFKSVLIKLYVYGAGYGGSLKEESTRSESEILSQHMYSNFQKQFKGLELKNLLWSAARSYIVQVGKKNGDDKELE